jgi:hypothetical protein
MSTHNASTGEMSAAGGKEILKVLFAEIFCFHWRNTLFLGRKQKTANVSHL